MSICHTEHSSIHQTSIQDNFAKKKLIVEKKVLIKDSTNSGLVLYSSQHYQQQKDLTDELDLNSKDSSIFSSNSEYARSHLDAKSSKVNFLEDRIANEKEQIHEIVQNREKGLYDGSSCEQKVECLSDDRLLNHLGYLTNQGQEKRTAHLEPDHLEHNTPNLQYNVTSEDIDKETKSKIKDFIAETRCNVDNKESISESNIDSSSEKFEASVRLKKLEERINNYTVNKLLSNHNNEQFSGKKSDTQISPLIQLESSYSYIANVQEINENAANTSSKSRVDSCIDFLSEKGEKSLTPEIENSTFDKANTLVSNAALCELISLKDITENNEKNNTDRKQKVNQSSRQPNTVAKECNKKPFFRDTNDDSSEKDENKLLANKERDTYEKTKTVFQTIHALEGSPSDSEICRIFSKEAIDLTNLDNSELSQRLSTESGPQRSYNTSSPTRELTPSKLYTHCEFNAIDFAIFNQFLNNNIYECYDELTEEFVDQIVKSSEADIGKDCNANCENSCDCSIEAIPLYNSVLTMRETTMGPLRGLLKKPNRPPTSRKNRVVFDETKNQFFDADYIILIREDCLYDEEEDNEPCTCGEHELVRICCDEGCCGYTDDGRTPPVRRHNMMVNGKQFYVFFFTNYIESEICTSN